jgi:hypothetical protein
MIVGEVGAIAPVTTVRRTFCGPGADSPAKQPHRRVWTHVVAPACDTHHNRMDAMNTVRNVVLAAAAVFNGNPEHIRTHHPERTHRCGPDLRCLAGVRRYGTRPRDTRRTRTHAASPSPPPRTVLRHPRRSVLRPARRTVLRLGARGKAMTTNDPGSGTWQPGTGSP